MSFYKKRILIVDDEEDLTWSISRGLSKDQEMLDIMCANSGIMALDILNQKPIDLVVTDLRMPGVSGLELLSEVRHRFPKVQVIVMTAYGSVDIKDDLNRYDKLGYIEKPFEMNDLRNLIYTYLDEETWVNQSLSGVGIEE